MYEVGVKSLKLEDLDMGCAIIDPDVIYIPLVNKTGEALIHIDTNTVIVFQNGWEAPMDILDAHKVYMSTRDLMELYSYLEVV